MINPLTSLRFIAAVVIILHHLAFPGGLGVIAVTFFFVISGFTMALGYKNKFDEITISNLKEFYFKRLIRIYPLYLLTALLSIPVMIYTNFQINLYNTITTLFMVQTYFPSGKDVFAFNSVSWFIADVVFFYLLTPFMIYAFSKIKNIKYLLPALAICLFLFQLIIAYQFRGQMEAYSTGWWFIYTSPYFRIFDYAIGLIAGILFCAPRNDFTKNIKTCMLFSMLEIGAIYFFIVSFKSTFLGFDAFKYGLYYIPASLLLVLVFALQKGIISIIMSNKILVYLGNLSFPIFLLHQLVILYTSIFFTSAFFEYSTEKTHVISQVILFVVIISLSDSLHRYFEIPVSNKLKRHLKRTL